MRRRCRLSTQGNVETTLRGVVNFSTSLVVMSQPGEYTLQLKAPKTVCPLKPRNVPHVTLRVRFGRAPSWRLALCCLRGKPDWCAPCLAAQVRPCIRGEYRNEGNTSW